MAWSTPLTAVANAALTAAQWNASVRDNLLETAPAKATAAGQLFVATGAGAIAARTIGQDRVDAVETTTSTTYGNLTTTGPAATVTSGGACLVIFTAQITNNTASAGSLATVEITGATTASLGDAGSIGHEPGAANADTTCSRVQYYAVNSGSNTFAMKYRVLTGTGSFSRRQLVVIPL